MPPVDGSSSAAGPPAKRHCNNGRNNGSSSSSSNSDHGESSCSENADDERYPLLVKALRAGDWEQATRMAIRTSEDASESSPLALACRLGAPESCVRAILKAAPEKLRHVLDARGTPLHEAVVCENMGPPVIRALLDADEALSVSGNHNINNHNNNNQTNNYTIGGPRATLLQDVDGFTPLHLLIRRRFQSHMLDLAATGNSSFMAIMEMLAKSCPDAVTIPDRGEYEEPPIVYAIKANIYSPSIDPPHMDNDSNNYDETTATVVERQIYHMVECMLRYNPRAATCVFEGYRGQYTALHSAVFHGRHSSLIRLLLKSENDSGCSSKAALLANTQGELPLHFCAMRGEQPHSMTLVAKAAPQAIGRRDASGLTPLHWLWVRFVSTIGTLEVDGRGNGTTLEIRPVAPSAQQPQQQQQQQRYESFANVEQKDFDADLRLIKRMDPPVDFLRMRHIPLNVLSEAHARGFAQRTVDVLQQVRERQSTQQENAEAPRTWNRWEVVMSLFWTKVVSLITTANRPESVEGDAVLVHRAFATPSCPPWISFVVASLFPEELSIPDNMGRLPLHHAARRAWHRWDWPKDESGTEEPHAAKLLYLESLQVFTIALDLSSPECVKARDQDGRLVLHHALDTFCRAGLARRQSNEAVLSRILVVLRRLVMIYPESLQQRDGATRLPPFLQATATATEAATPTTNTATAKSQDNNNNNNREEESHSLSIAFELLRLDPTLLVSP